MFPDVKKHSLLYLLLWSLPVFDIRVASAQSLFLNHQTQTASLFVNNNSFSPLRKLFPKVNIISGHSSNSSLHYNYHHLAERCTSLLRWPILSACQQSFIRHIKASKFEYTKWEVRNNKASSDHTLFKKFKSACNIFSWSKREGNMLTMPITLGFILTTVSNISIKVYKTGLNIFLLLVQREL